MKRLLKLISSHAKCNLQDDAKYIEFVLAEARKCQKSDTLCGMFISKRLWQMIQLQERRENDLIKAFNYRFETNKTIQSRIQKFNRNFSKPKQQRLVKSVTIQEEKDIVESLSLKSSLRGISFKALVERARSENREEKKENEYGLISPQLLNSHFGLDDQSDDRL